MVLVPETPSTLYDQVPVPELLKRSVAVPTARRFTCEALNVGFAKEGPAAAYRSPEYVMESVHVPWGTWNHVILPSASYVYQMAKMMLLGCWMMFRPQPDSFGFHQRSVKSYAGPAVVGLRYG